MAITVEDAAQMCVNASDRRIKKAIAPNLVWAMQYVNQILPMTMEPIIKRQAKL